MQAVEISAQFCSCVYILETGKRRILTDVALIVGQIEITQDIICGSQAVGTYETPGGDDVSSTNHHQRLLPKHLNTNRPEIRGCKLIARTLIESRDRRLLPAKFRTSRIEHLNLRPQWTSDLTLGCN